MAYENEVATAFDILLKEIENAIKELDQEAIKALEKSDRKRARELAEKGLQMEAIQDKVKHIHKEWGNLFPGKERPEHSTITIELTQGSINGNYIPLRKHKDFFPPDSIGGSSKRKGEGRPLRLYLEGIAEPIDTDIEANCRFFRWRGWSKFFGLHSLRAGDEVVIEKVSDYDYKVYPKSE